MMDRPYCLQELKDLESELHDKYRLSNVFAHHYPCDHKYRVKKGGRKEQFILDSQLNSNEDCGNFSPWLLSDYALRDMSQSVPKVPKPLLDDQTCSICFKLRTSIENNKPSLETIDIIKNNDNIDNEIADQNNKNMNFEFLKKKIHFYKWLFQHDY